jgi:uncharacterized protein (TIGR02145 family)
LTNFLGGDEVAGGKLKEIRTTHWNSPNSGATNETGFTALPNGLCSSDGSFGYLGLDGIWWSATEADATYAWSRGMFSDSGGVNRGGSFKVLGFSIRFVKD